LGNLQYIFKYSLVSPEKFSAVISKNSQRSQRRHKARQDKRQKNTKYKIQNTKNKRQKTKSPYTLIPLYRYTQKPATSTQQPMNHSTNLFCALSVLRELRESSSETKNQQPLNPFPGINYLDFSG
jgi:hypothetical protein